MKGCFQQNGSEALTLGRNLNSFLGSVNFTANVVAVTLEFLYREILVCFVYLKADLKGYCSSLI